MTDKKMVNFTIRLTRQMHDRIKTLAGKEYRSLNGQVASIIDHYFRQEASAGTHFECQGEGGTYVAFDKVDHGMVRIDVGTDVQVLVRRTVTINKLAEILSNGKDHDE